MLPGTTYFPAFSADVFVPSPALQKPAWEMAPKGNQEPDQGWSFQDMPEIWDPLSPPYHPMTCKNHTEAKFWDNSLSPEKKCRK